MVKAGSILRTENYIRQVKRSAVLKVLAALVSFLTVPLMIHYLGQVQYGIWSTLLAIMSWIVYFDLGVGNGLRNKLAESLANNKPAQAVSYISTAYMCLGGGVFALFVGIAVLAAFIPWQAVFNTTALTELELKNVVVIAAFLILLNFWVGLINQVLNAVQKTSWVVLGQFIASVCSLIVVLILAKATNPSLLYMTAGYGMAMVAASLAMSIAFYNNRTELAPKLFFNRSYIKPLLSTGLQFFTIQLAVLLIFATDKILITQLFGPSYVASYDVVFKLFSLITILHGLVSAPLWSAYTDAYHRNDTEWIKMTLFKQLRFYIALVLAASALAIVAKPIIALWIGREVVVQEWLVPSMCAFTLIAAWNNIYAYLLNGIGVIRVQIYTAVAALIMNVPLAIMLTKLLGVGLHGIVLATCLSLTIFAIVGPIQVISILRGSKHPLGGTT